ncbi:syntaphilin isoform X1 [Zalophus californianus]|uniref:Syntaphilin isoform X1 n=2 Tax=Zalophus californianus TaxID=9704 RepID=A0A6J2FHG3_ZALCA|nr:syntaphilin isoform X1 [Zalophus californianus]
MLSGHDPPGTPPILPLTRTRSLMAMSLPGSRRASAGSRSGGPLGRSGLAVFAQCPQLPASPNEHLPLLPASRRTSPPVSVRDAYGTSSLSSSSNSGSCKGSDSSPTPRRSMKYTLCSDNHGVKPPTPEQYLTPLQQKEVCIRHLKARLKDTQDRLQDRDTEIDDLKTQLSRMQEDWIEEECHRVEAQLALKEARKEIKQLKQVIDTVKNNLIDKDKGLQKYFVDINIQNKKLETLLHSMEVAQNGTAKEDGTGESAGGSPARSLTRSSTYTKLSDPAVCGDRPPSDHPGASAEDGADSGFAGLTEDTLSRTDALEASSLLSSGVDCGPEEGSLHSSFGLGPRFPASNTYEKLLCGLEAGVQASCMQERAIQTDFAQYQPDLDAILEKVTQAQVCGAVPELGVGDPELEPHPPGPKDPTSAVVVTVGDELEAPEPITRGPSAHRPGANRSPGPSVSVACPLEEEEAAAAEKEPKSYWSRHYIVDLLAVVVPAVPTVAWLCRSQRRQGQPVYNISSLLRGCCTVALHSIRRASCRSLSPHGPSAAAGSSQL